jgi:hypothetical protein
MGSVGAVQVQTREARSGTRVACNIPVVLTSSNSIRWSSEPGVVILANPQGCGIKCSRPVETGTVLLLNGLPTAKMVSARVVNCISVAEKLWILGLALEHPGNVWGIESPPEDWASDSNESKP